MEQNNMCFCTDEIISINNRQYRIVGYVNLRNSLDESNWTEYKLIDINNGVVKWLSIDIKYKEYALYTKSSSQVESYIKDGSYHQVDTGKAQIMDVHGETDSFYGEEVYFEEFEDSSEEKIIGIERWGDETEYWTGLYLDSYEIQRDSTNNRSHMSNTNSMDTDMYQNDMSNTSNSLSGPSKMKRYGILALVIMLMITPACNLISHFNKVDLLEKINDDNRFEYITSMTADLNNSHKANVYRANGMTISDATKAILHHAGDSLEKVDENVEDKSVAIMTKSNYCLVYTSESNEILVQVSGREYAYSSTHVPYRSYRTTGLFYRNYYYRYGYNSDRNRFNNQNTAYKSYTAGKTNVSTNNVYEDYANTIRQGSTSNRSSSGGGTSFGK